MAVNAPVPAVIVEAGPDGPTLRVMATHRLEASEARELARCLDRMANEIDPREDDAPCLHTSFYWINRKNLNWRCIDKCGCQFHGITVTEKRREAKANKRKGGA